MIETIWNDLDREQKKLYEKSKPRCFPDGKQYWLWRESARFSQPEPHHEWCEDCMLEYQTKMISEGRCRFPGTIFVSAGSNQHTKKSTDGGTIHSNPGLGLDVEGKRPFWYIKQVRRDLV